VDTWLSRAKTELDHWLVDKRLLWADDRGMATEKTCRDCGRKFKPSRTDATVRCPECRVTPRSTVAGYEAKYIEAKARGWAARRAGDRAAEAAAVEDMKFYRAAIERTR